MGRPRVKIIDDSQSEKEVKKPQAKPAKKKEEDSLVAKLKEELGIEETSAISDQLSDKTQKKASAAGDGEEGSRGVAGANEMSEDAPRDTEPAGSASERSTKKQAKPAKIRSKKYLLASKDLDRNKFYPLPEALDMVKKMSYAKFKYGQGTLEAHINTTQTGIRGLVSLPYASGKKIRILAFGKGADTSGADIFGDDSTIDSISQGKIDFDILITTPEWMVKLAKVAKILGPRGLMPNPKSGTITSEDGLKKAVESFQSGKSEYKTEAKGKIIHLGLGRLSQPNEELEINIKTLLQTLGKTKISKVTLSPTMGPGVKVDLNSL